jgi:hypothetical protein
MPLNIPMPSLDRSGLFEGLLHGHQRQDRQRQMEMQQKHHEDTHAIQQQQQARLAELQPYVIEQYKQKAAMHPFIMEQYKQAQALAPLERQLKMAQINAAISEQAQKEFDQNFVKQFMGGQMGGQGSPMHQPGVQMPGQQSMPQAGQPNVAPPSMEQLQQGFGGHNVHPVVAAKMKKLSGWDPNEQTPDQKRQAEMQQFQEKEKFKADQKRNIDLTEVTPANRTAAQKVIVAANEVRPLLAQLIATDVPGAKTGVFSPEQQALANSIKNLSADDLMAIFSLPKDQHSSKMVEQMVTRQPFEGIDAYRKRLKWLDGRIEHKEKGASHLLKSGKVAAVNHEENNSAEKIYNPATRSWE